MQDAYLDMVTELDAEFVATLTRLNHKSRIYGEMILSLARYESPSSLAESLNVSQSFIPKYLKYLIGIGIARKTHRGKYELSDPVFRDWVLNKFEPLYD